MEVCANGSDTDCSYEPQIKSNTKNTNKKGYKINRSTWMTTKLNDPNINGYCAYKN